MVLNINTDAAVLFTVKLEKLHKSALPLAIRNTLNSAAFDVKQNTMPRNAADTFKNRQPNFFRANSRVEMAKGFNMNQMRATVGFTQQGLKGSNNYAVKDLEQQEKGGVIKSRSFIPMDPARAGNNNAKAVRPVNRLSGINNIVNARNAKGKNDKQKFTKSVFHAGKGGHVLAEYKGREILWRVNSLKRTKSGQFKLTPIYSFEANRDITVKGTGFMKESSLETAAKMDRLFISQAKKQIEKLR